MVWKMCTFVLEEPPATIFKMEIGRKDFSPEVGGSESFEDLIPVYQTTQCYTPIAKLNFMKLYSCSLCVTLILRCLSCTELDVGITPMYFVLYPLGPYTSLSCIDFEYQYKKM